MGGQAVNLQTTIISYNFGLIIFERSIPQKARTPLVYISILINQTHTFHGQYDQQLLQQAVVVQDLLI